MYTTNPDDEPSNARELIDETEARAGREGGGRRFRRFWHEVGLLARMAKSVYAGEYELETPKILALVTTLGYVVSPIDAIPDVIPVLGLVDDAGVVTGTLTLLSYELIQYREWERAHAA